MRKIAEEIVKGKNLEENLPVYAGKMMSMYNDYSYVRLSMNYFTYYEMVIEAENKDEQLKQIMEVFNRIVNDGIINNAVGSDWEKLVEDVDGIRGKVINIMKGLTAYVDIFNIYEYCLNRVEYNFTDGSEFLTDSDEELSKQILQYILSDNDSVVINGKIAEVVRQLPMRMTKGRFFELLKEGIRVYTGSEISSVEDFIYMIKTTSMVEVSPYTELLSEDIKAGYEEFGNVKFSELTREKYYDLKSKIDFAVAYIMQSINMYMSLGELINDVYVILLSSVYKLEESRDSVICNAIIKKINNLFDEGELSEIYDNITEDFIKLEGRQETLYTKFSAYEYVIEQVFDKNQDILSSLMLDKIYNSLKRIMALESGSIFVEFNEVNNDIADEGYIEKVTEAFINELSEMFKKNEKIVNRAVMAHVISGLPVFFNNINEIQDYIYNSLSQCTNKAEKAAVTEIMRQLINEE